MKRITDEEIVEGFAPLKTFLTELADVADIISNMQFPDESKAAQVENITVTRIIKRCGKNVADATGYALRNPVKTMHRLTRKQADKLAAVARQDREDSRLASEQTAPPIGAEKRVEFNEILNSVDAGAEGGKNGKQ
jgi:hypothetical protein